MPSRNLENVHLLFLHVQSDTNALRITMNLLLKENYLLHTKGSIWGII